MRLVALYRTRVNGRDLAPGERFESLHHDEISSLLESGTAAPADPEAFARWRAERHADRPRAWMRRR